MTIPQNVSLQFEFPVHVIMPPTLNIGDLAGFLKKDSKGLLLFTDKRNAKDFLDANSAVLTGHNIRDIVDPWHLFGLLVLAEKAAFSHVFIDPIHGSIASAFPIVDLRADLEHVAH
jgi:hypothetical protein